MLKEGMIIPPYDKDKVIIWDLEGSSKKDEDMIKRTLRLMHENSFYGLRDPRAEKYLAKYGKLDAELSKEFTKLPESYELPANAGLARAKLLIEKKMGNMLHEDENKEGSSK
jgi:hypothetical protein